MSDTKCCKKPKCDTKQGKCPKKKFMFSPMFWKLLVVANFFIIIIRVSYLKFNLDFKFLLFLLWLELQIIAFYILLITAYAIYHALYKLLLLDKAFLKSLFSKRAPNRFMKWLNLINTDNILSGLDGFFDGCTVVQNFFFVAKIPKKTYLTDIFIFSFLDSFFLDLFKNVRVFIPGLMVKKL